MRYYYVQFLNRFFPRVTLEEVLTSRCPFL